VSAHSTSRKASSVHLPPTSLVICSRNRRQLLFESVESVLGGEDLPSELIIMDQSDEQDARLAGMGRVSGCHVRYELTTTIGESPARNLGIRLARHEILTFTDDDVQVTPTWFGTLVRALLDANARTVVTGRVLASAEGDAASFAPSTKEDAAPAVYVGRIREDVLYPMSMAMYRSAIAEVGDFDVRLGAGARFPGGEDNDFSFRLLEAGYSIRYVPEALLYHRAWRAYNQFVQLQWSYGRGQGAFLAKHLSLSDRYMLSRLRSELGERVWRSLRYSLRRSRRETFGDLAYAAGLVTGAAQWLATQPKR
jgi:GT2 family glycosyltransferase